MPILLSSLTSSYATATVTVGDTTFVLKAPSARIEALIDELCPVVKANDRTMRSNPEFLKRESASMLTRACAKLAVASALAGDEHAIEGPDGAWNEAWTKEHYRSFAEHMAEHMTTNTIGQLLEALQEADANPQGSESAAARIGTSDVAGN